MTDGEDPLGAFKGCLYGLVVAIALWAIAAFALLALGVL